MSEPIKFHRSKHNWATLGFTDLGNKIILEERSKHDAARHISETVVCVIVGLLILGSYVLFVLPETHSVNAYHGVSLSVVMVGIALTLYAFATRGYKPQVGFDKLRKQVWICKLNSKEHARITTHFPKKDVRSIFIQRPEAGSKDAALLARLGGKARPVTLLRGSLNDIEAAHHELCEVLRDVPIVRPVRPVLRVDFRTPRPARTFREAAA